MFVVTTTPSSSSINHYLKHRSIRHSPWKHNNLTDTNGTTSMSRIEIIGISHSHNKIKNLSTLTKTQVKVICTVVVIISLILLIIAIFRFKSACRSRETADRLQTEIVRNSALQYNEPSSRRGSVGYYTRKYSQTTSIRSNNQINNLLPNKRLSIPACDQASKSTAVVTLSSSPVDTTDVTHHHHVISSCDTSNISNQHVSIVSTAFINIKSPTNKFVSSIATIVEETNKLSSPTLRKLCLPCITTRQHIRQHKKQKNIQLSTHQRYAAHENKCIELLNEFKHTPRTYDAAKSTVPVVYNNECSIDSHGQHQPCEISLQNEKHDDISVVNKEIKPISSDVGESELITLPSNPLHDEELCDDRTPLITSEPASINKTSSNLKTRQYSFNALLPYRRSSSTSTNINDNQIINDADVKPRHRASLSSAIRRTSYAKQPQAFCSTVDSTNTARTVTPTSQPLDSNKNSQEQVQSYDSSNSKSSAITKNFMHKIQRFRFIDDSASSTTTITSPVESLDQVDTYSSACNRLIANTVEQFDNFVRARCNQTNSDDNDGDSPINSLIDRLNSNILTNGSYSDLNILNETSPIKPIQRPQTFKPVNSNVFQVDITTAKPLPTCQQHKIHQSIPINIPHSLTSLPLSNQRNHIDYNGYSRSMDFQPIKPMRDIKTRHETRPTTSSSSSTATLTSIQSLNSLEFDDSIKPSGVLVDDDFLPMSSPVDEHFWTLNITSFDGLNSNKCFPDVGSSPDIEVKQFDYQKFNTLSETSDDDDDDDDSTTSTDQIETFALHEDAIGKSKKSTSEEEVPDGASSSPSTESTEHLSMTNIGKSVSTPPEMSLNESLLENFCLPTQTSMASDFVCDTPLQTNQQSQNEVPEEDDTQDSSTNETSEGDDSADNGEIDLVHEFELSQKEKQNNSWPINDRDVYIIQDDDLLSALITTPAIVNRTQPTSIMKITNSKTSESIDEQPQPTLKPKVRFNLDPEYEREREWNKVNKLLGNSVEWTDEFEV